MRSRIHADRDHQSAADLQLFLERLRNLGPARRDDDRVIRRCRGPAEGPIGMHDMDVAVPERLQRRSRIFGKLANTLDRTISQPYIVALMTEALDLLGEFAQTLRKKRLPRDLSQSIEHRFGPDAARHDLIFDHALAKRRKITHWSLRSGGTQVDS